MTIPAVVVDVLVPLLKGTLGVLESRLQRQHLITQ